MSRHHTASVETLVHTNGGNGDGYWGLSDIDVDEITGRTWFCTHCGHEVEFGELIRNK